MGRFWLSWNGRGGEGRELKESAKAAPIVRGSGNRFGGGGRNWLGTGTGVGAVTNG